MTETITKNSKKTPVFVIAGAVGFFVLLAFSGAIGDKASEQVVNAQINEETQVQLDRLQLQLNNTFIVLQAHEVYIQGHEVILQEHNTQISGIRNNTNTVVDWAEEFSNNVDNRLITIEENQK